MSLPPAAQATQLPCEPRHIPAYAAWDDGTPNTWAGTVTKGLPFIEPDTLVRPGLRVTIEAGLRVITEAGLRVIMDVCGPNCRCMGVGEWQRLVTTQLFTQVVCGACLLSRIFLCLHAFRLLIVPTQ